MSTNHVVDVDGLDGCRFCFDDEEDAESGKLITPCMCKGSQALVHRNCLQKWRTTNTNTECFSKCTTCKFRYRVKPTLDLAARPISKTAHFKLLVTRDVIAMVLVLQLMIAACAGIVYASDYKDNNGTGSWTENFPDSWSDTSCYYVLGFAGFILLVGFVALIAILVATICTGDMHCHCFYCWYWNPDSCGTCDCTSGGACGEGGCADCGGDGEGMAIIAIVILAVIAVIGTFVTIYYIYKGIRGSVATHLSIIQRSLDSEEHEVIDLKGMSKLQIFDLPDIQDPAYAEKEVEEGSDDDGDDDSDDDGDASSVGSGGSSGSDGSGDGSGVVSKQPRGGGGGRSAADAVAAKIQPWSAGQAAGNSDSNSNDAPGQLDAGYIPFGDVDNAPASGAESDSSTE